MCVDSIRTGIKAEIDRGLEALATANAAQANLQFANALFLAEEIPDERQRRDQFAALATLFESSGFSALSKLAAVQALTLDKTLGLGTLIAEDLCHLAALYLKLDDPRASEQCYRETLPILISAGQLAR